MPVNLWRFPECSEPYYLQGPVANPINIQSSQRPSD